MRQDCTYYGLCYTSRVALAGIRNSSMGPPLGFDLMIPQTMSGCSAMELHLAPWLSEMSG